MLPYSLVTSILRLLRNQVNYFSSTCFHHLSFQPTELVGSVRKHEECPDTALECETKSDTPGQRSAEQSMLRLNDDDLNSLLPIEKYALKYFSM